MDRLQCMKVLVKVAETASFAEAARQLHMSPPAVTRAIAFLEDSTGARLFVRSTRSVKLTSSGARYVDDCRRILADVDEAEASAGGSHATASGVLTVTAPVLFGQMHMVPAIAEFLQLYPGVTARVLLFDRIVSLVEEGIDVAVRIGHLQDSDQTAIRVGSVRRVVCGAPAYFERHGIPLIPSDLAGHVTIVSTGSSAPLDWHFGPDGTAVTLHPRMSCNTMDASIAAALTGWGLSRPLSYQVTRHVAAGQLRTVLEDYEEEPLPIHVVHTEGRHVSAKTRAFVDFAVQKLRSLEL
ncbi:LysR family transcriptional regulator [Rhizobium sp. Root1220]|uniref:LysR family transcriptional regulator n=1 Tax=Rhizobium sp. Root1220 TaxID=1736432 RepID=UPI0006FAE366|nr:LysR family transcriptional regulator [Rhizobium sp. Root1220]KQV83640.1 LysR family transcriptional regulator [Rhizobium sp. Root1220]